MHKIYFSPYIKAKSGKTLNSGICYLSTQGQIKIPVSGQDEALAKIAGIGQVSWVIVEKGASDMPGSSILKPAAILLAATVLSSIFAPAVTAEEDLKLSGGIAYMRMDETSPEHPSWMKGSVYSTKDMTLRVFQDVHFLFSKTRIKSTIPDYTTSSVILRKRVLEHWSGYVPSGTCRVTTVPIMEGGEPVGSFEFHHFDSRGPKGYLQSMGRDKDGYMQYRIWFVDQIAQNPQSESPQ